MFADYNKFIELAPTAQGIEIVYNNRSMIRLRRGEIEGL